MTLRRLPSRAGPECLFGLATVRGTGEEPGIVEIVEWSAFSCRIRAEMPLSQYDHVCLRLGSDTTIETVVSWTCNGVAGLRFNGPVRLEDGRLAAPDSSGRARRLVGDVPRSGPDAHEAGAAPP